MRRRVPHWLPLVIFFALTVLPRSVAGATSAERPSFFITPTWGTLSSPLGWRHDPFQPLLWNYHWGIDIATAAGTPVLASAAGVVKYAAPYGGYGWTIVIEHQAEWATL